MLALCIILTTFLCCALAACSYLYATHRANVRLQRRQDRLNVKLDRQASALLDRVLQRHGSAPINTPPERPGPTQSFIPSSPWEEEWAEQEREDEERAKGYALNVADLTDEQKAELKRRVGRVANE